MTIYKWLLFDADGTLFDYDEIGFAKPAAEFFDIAFKEMGDPARKDVMIIGDSLTSDMAGGIEYGIDTCWYNPHQIKNESKNNITCEISELQEILKIVNDMSQRQA